MPLGYVIAGMALGFVSAILMLVLGSGFGMAFLAYAGFGSLGTGLAVVMAMMGRVVHQPSHSITVS